MNRVRIVLACVLVAALASCAPGSNSLAGVALPGQELDGFWMGLWHGLIVPITFVISLFKDSVGIYEVHNNGGWYDAGFLLGASISIGGGSHAGSRPPKVRRQRKDDATTV